MNQQEIQIQQVDAGERYNNEVAYNYEDFKKYTTLNNIEDLFDKNLKIKKDGEKYVFNKDNKNIFAVNGAISLQYFFNRFYEDKKLNDKQQEQEEFLISINGLEIKYQVGKTAQELDVLRQETMKQNQELEDARDLEKVKEKIDFLISKFETQKDIAISNKNLITGSDYNKQDRKFWDVQERELNVRLRKLNTMKEELSVSSATQDDFQTQQKLLSYAPTLKKIDKEYPEFDFWGNEIINHRAKYPPAYEMEVYKISDARDIKNDILKANKFLAKLNKQELAGDKAAELHEDLKRFEVYLNNILSDPNNFRPSEHPFETKNLKEFNALIALEPELQTLINNNGIKIQQQNGTNTGPSNNESGTINTGATNTENMTEEQKAKAEYTSRAESFQKGGIAGLGSFGLDKTHMTEEQKNTWKGVGNLAMTGGMIFVGWKMISSAFKLLFKGKSMKDEERTKAWGWLLGPTALIFGANAIGGESPMKLLSGGKLTEIMGGRFGGKKSETLNKTEKMGLGITGATAMFSDFNNLQVSQFLEEDNNGNMKVRADQYDAMIKAYEEKGNTAAVEFLKNIGKDDKKGLMNLGLTAMGITSLQSLTDNPDKKFSEASAGAIVRVQTISSTMEKGGYHSINPEKMDLVEKYISNPESQIDDLEALEMRGDIFLKDDDLKERIPGMDEKINTITNDPIKQTEIKRSLNRFYDAMPANETEKKAINISGTWPNIEFKTYENTTKIDIENKKINGFDQTFGSSIELFKATSLVNFIKKTVKDKQAQSVEPFKISTPGGDIEFDDAKVWDFKTDTEIVSAGIGGNLSKISPTLENHKESFMKYLNNNVTYKRYVATTS